MIFVNCDWGRLGMVHVCDAFAGTEMEVNVNIAALC